jgi:hypothetical protein
MVNFRGRAMSAPEEIDPELDALLSELCREIKDLLATHNAEEVAAIMHARRTYRKSFYEEPPQ